MIGFPRQEYWSELPLPTPGDLSDPESESEFPDWQADSLPLSHQGSPHEWVSVQFSSVQSLSCVPLFVIPLTVACQTSLSMGFSRQEYQSGLPFPSPMHENESEVAQSCLTPSDPMDCSPLGPSVHGVFQARVLEWGAIAFSDTNGL